MPGASLPFAGKARSHGRIPERLLVAFEEGFDHVFEVSGETSSQLSTLIYIRNATDLTDRVIKELNKKQSKEKVPTNSGG